ncbi:small, acid-soluble spore protein, alpha/beta type [Anaeromicropila populeti]|uniref:Small, acid-soluble spore protein, alpha/beta type n=1 Tax=Anaeromicropila populeti TaxID=37658 RepID=A0A1I6HPZ4_9FIRM|nr:small, acid-soluble spore protein, alpha/beta type [Anaeromicropila populeti]SFR56437.1 Small, acid-soluble spore protein, alpha/beta type [Anaeromicropila populeti]
MPKGKEKKEIENMEDVKMLPKDEQLKYEIAEEIGVIDKVFSTGWRSLSAKESGRIGGILANRKKKGTQ